MLGRVQVILNSSLYLPKLLVVHGPDGDDFPAVGLLDGGDLLLQRAVLQLQGPHLVDVGSQPVIKLSKSPALS